MKNKTSLILLVLTITVIIYACSGSKDDKYNLLSKKDKRLINEICDCTDPLGEFYERAMNTKDSLLARQILDSLDIIAKGNGDCLRKLDSLELSNKSSDYEKQFIEYIQTKSRFCIMLFLGNEGVIKHNKK